MRMTQASDNRRATPSRRGQVLLLTLALLVVAVSSLVVLSTRSLARVQESIVAQSELRRRWALRSIEAALLSRADSILSRHERLQQGSLATLTSTVVLNDRDYVITLCDEQAKVNVNRLWDEHGIAGMQRVELTLRRLAASSGGSPANITLRPTPPTSASNRSPKQPVFVGMGQVFADAAGLTPSLSSPISGITLWGDGRINVRRATRPVVEVVLGEVLSPWHIAAIIESQHEMAISDKPIDPLRGLDLTNDERVEAQRRLSLGSEVYALWILSEGRTRLSIRNSQRPTPLIDVFEW